MKKVVKTSLLILLIFINIVLYFGLKWTIENVGLVSIDEVIFHIKMPLEGTSHDMIKDVMFHYVIPALFVLIFIIVVIVYKQKNKVEFKIKIFKKNCIVTLNEMIKKILFIVNIFVLAMQLLDINNKFKVLDYLKFQRQKSPFIEDNYVDPKEIKISFPDEKRNLIYIYLESMETTYSDKENGGNQDKNIIPELTDLALANTNFSNTKKLGGAYPISSTTWTIAGMVAQTSGIPLKMPFDSNTYIGYDKFLPGVYNLGDILKENGYNQVLMIGSDAKFAGRDTFFKTHGNYEIKDYYKAIEEKIIDKNHYEFWGMEDSYLFEWAKEELLQLNEKDEPFNLTMLTVNTHFPEGYVENNCEKEFEDNYSNSIYCSSKQVYEFIEWLKEQEFYDNTTIIITGDHLTMAQNTILESDNYKRTIFNTIINSSIDAKNNKKRKFTSFDMFPTTLASLGAKIEGNKLGLGVNLYSKEKTIIEKYGLNKVDKEIQKKSTFYDKKLLYGE